MGFGKALADFGMQAAGEFAGAGIQSLFSGQAEDKAWERQKIIMRNRHQWEMEDLRKAGLNPILTATKGIGGGAPGVSIPPRSQPSHLDWVAARKLEAETELLREKSESERISRTEMSARAGLLGAQTEKVPYEVGLADAQAQESAARRAVYLVDELVRIGEVDLNSARATETRERTKLVIQQAETEIQRARELQASGDLKGAEAKLKAYEMKFYEALESTLGDLGVGSARVIGPVLGRIWQMLTR